MSFCPNQLKRPYRTRSYIMSGSTRPPQTSELFGELAPLVRLRLGLLVVFTGEFVSPYFHYCITFIHILKQNYHMLWVMSKSLERKILSYYY